MISYLIWDNIDGLGLKEDLFDEYEVGSSIQLAKRKLFSINML